MKKKLLTLLLAAAIGLPVGAMTVATPESDPDPSVLESIVSEQRLHWSTTVRSEDVAEGISACAREHDAIISMATSGSERSAAIVGSTAVDVVKHATWPVMLVGPGAEVVERRPITELVVAVSGRGDESICGAAAALAETYGFGLRLVTVAPRTGGSVDSMGSFGPQGDADAYVASLVARIETSGLEVVGEVIRDPESPASGLAQTMRHRPQALLVLGTRSRTGLERLRRGSVASSIVAASPVPTVLLPLR